MDFFRTACDFVTSTIMSPGQLPFVSSWGTNALDHIFFLITFVFVWLSVFRFCFPFPQQFRFKRIRITLGLRPQAFNVRSIWFWDINSSIAVLQQQTEAAMMSLMLLSSVLISPSTYGNHVLIDCQIQCVYLAQTWAVGTYTTNKTGSNRINFNMQNF